MLLQYYGHCCFALQASDGRRVLIDPYDARIGYRSPRGGAPITLVSRDHFAHNHLPSVLGRTVAIRGAAPRTVEGIPVRGLLGSHGPTGEVVVCFCLEVDGLRVCHLSMVGSLPAGQVRALTPVDVLLFPCGGAGSLEPGQAAEIVRQTRPRWAVPMGFATPFLDRTLFPGLLPAERLSELLKLERQRDSTLELGGDSPSGTRVIWLAHEC